MNDEEKKAELFIKSVLELWESGIEQDDELVEELKKRFSGTEDDFHIALEMIRTGNFRAAIISGGHSYPKGNLNIEDDVILKTAFKMQWIKLKGEQHYLDNYENRTRVENKTSKWWRFWK